MMTAEAPAAPQAQRGGGAGARGAAAAMANLNPDGSLVSPAGYWTGCLQEGEVHAWTDGRKPAESA
eukprot:951698-Pelagomonas_calceolata.AAC.2